MKIIQVLLPIYNPEGEWSKEMYSEIRSELTEKFGGITAYTRSPAVGLWKEEEDKTVKDDIIIYEVMADDFHENWWKGYQANLQAVFKQDKIVIRSWPINSI